MSKVLTARILSTKRYQEKLYSLQIHHMLSSASIRMALNIPIVNTYSLPFTYTILTKHLPSIFSSACFNDQKLPFSQEVKATEIGHLFEHMLLEYLCSEKTAQKYNDVVFNGYTEWDFIKDGEGVFHIHVDVPYTDSAVLIDALRKTIQLMNIILQSSPSVKKDFSFSTHKQIASDYLFAESVSNL